jgi:hypothetical protein
LLERLNKGETITGGTRTGGFTIGGTGFTIRGTGIGGFELTVEIMDALCSFADC